MSLLPIVPESSVEQLSATAQDTFGAIRGGADIPAFLSDRLRTSFEGIRLQVIKGKSGFLPLPPVHSDAASSHAAAVALFTLHYATAMKIDDDEIPDMALSAFLADIGKARIPQDVLYKTGELTSRDRALLNAHVQVGYTLIDRLHRENPEDFALATAKISALLHHLNFDGTGYPGGEVIEGSGISMGYQRMPQVTRIIALADMMAALLYPRPQRAGLSPDRAIRTLLKESYRKFDPRLVQNFLRHLALPINQGVPFYAPGDYVVLYSPLAGIRSGVREFARIESIDENNIMRPQITLLYDLTNSRSLGRLPLQLINDPARYLISFVDDPNQLAKLAQL